MRIWWSVGVVLSLVCVGWVMAGYAAGTHAAPQAKTTQRAACEICGKSIDTQHAVTVKQSGVKKVHQYRCIHCALVASRDWLKTDVTINATSARGTAVQWTRRHGKWSVSPATARVLSLPEAKGDCATTHVIFADEGEAKAYLRSHSLSKATPFTGTDINGILEAGKKEAPKQATCPVMGRTITVTKKTDWTVYQGKTYYFCCPGCKPKFTADPTGYIQHTAPKLDSKEGCGSHEGGCKCE